MRIEQSPFTGWFTSFGGASADSVVGELRTDFRDETHAKNKRYDVLKWNRQDIPTGEEALAAAQFKQRSLVLYQEALGEEFIVPTEFIVGNKRDPNGVKLKVYQLQPFIEGCSAKDVDEEVRCHPEVLSQWEVLSARLFNLYHTANRINQDFPGNEFPITMTVGSSRQLSLFAYKSDKLPKTKNILIRNDDLRLQLFDFGEYTLWHPGMQEAYEKIMSTVRLPRTAVVFDTNIDTIAAD